MSNLKKITHTHKIYKNTITNQKSLLETHAKKKGGGNSIINTEDRHQITKEEKKQGGPTKTQNN